jgi:uncharacterized Zn-binding protein involved in type VI secretion
MQRYYLRKGDRSSTGGVIVEGHERHTHHGVPLTYLGAKVQCPSCKSEGYVAGRGPRWSDTTLGKEAALSGDICICKCVPPPLLYASQDNYRQTLEGNESPQEIESEGSSSERPSRRVFVFDTATGEPVKDRRIIVEIGGVHHDSRTDQQGYATIETDAPDSCRIHVTFVSPKRELAPDEGA